MKRKKVMVMRTKSPNLNHRPKGLRSEYLLQSLPKHSECAKKVLLCCCGVSGWKSSFVGRSFKKNIPPGLGGP